MNIEELVTNIRARLQESGETVVSEYITQVLAEAGIVEVLAKQVEIETPKRLLIRHIYFSGFKEQSQGSRSDPFTYSRTLDNGINLWVGGNDTGKSTILKCVLWALTGKEPNLKKDVLKWLTEVAIEFWLDDDPYLVQFSLDSGNVMGKVYGGTFDEFQRDGKLPPLNGFSDSKSMAVAVADLFGERLGFSTLKWLKPSRQFSVNLSETTIRWDIYSQVMFIGDDEHSDYLFPRRDLNGRHHQKVLGMYLGLDLLEAVSRAQMERDRARYDYNLVRKSLSMNAAQLKSRIQSTDNQLREIEDKLSRLESSQSVLTGETHLQEVSERVAEYARLIRSLTQTQEELEAEYQALVSNLHTAERSRQAILESIKYKVFLNNLQIDVCPHCESRIKVVSEAEEIEKGICRVCHNELKSNTFIEAHEDVLAALEEQIKEHRSEQRKVKKVLKKLETELTQAHETHSREAAMLVDASRQAQAGFSTELKDLVNQRGFLQGQLRELQAQTTEGQADHLKQAKLKTTILNFAHKQLEGVMSSQNKGLMTDLERFTLEIATLFRVNLQRLKFDDRLTLLVTQHGETFPFGELTASEQVRTKLAFHLALLSQRLNTGIGRHPALVILDAPAPKELDEASVSGIIDGLAKIQSRFGEHFQLLLATIDPTLTAVTSSDLIQEKGKGEYFF